MGKKQYYIVMDICLKRQMPGRELGELDTRRKIKTIIDQYLEKKLLACELLVVQPDKINLKVVVEDPMKLAKEVEKRIILYANVESVHYTELALHLVK